MILNDKRKVHLNRRRKQKKTAELLGIELQPRWPEHPSVQRLMHQYRYNRTNVELHTLGALWADMERTPLREVRTADHDCAKLGKALVQGDWLWVIVCKKHHELQPKLWIYIEGFGVGKMWLKKMLPKVYKEWVENAYSEQSKTEWEEIENTYKGVKTKMILEVPQCKP